MSNDLPANLTIPEQARHDAGEIDSICVDNLVTSEEIREENSEVVPRRYSPLKD